MSLQQRLSALTQEEREKLESLQDADTVNWFNRTKVDERDKRLKTMPGCFYKVRVQGSATAKDCEEVNRFYKRSLVTCGLLLLQSYGLIQFGYQSRLLS